ncbi:hypothetical protein BC938DRAFT_470617 [Jimgerdemannia flammicorona]|uniref:Uncharacterized protein n=1 Tax=Jimgerdemannia flammicorona TaxID=994334 RepID=A0A433Q9U4_9FUNG|nr:hypothetical protein BC938DRAFT_470617 [Jimgerdemannia flammicorona]
MAFVGLFMAIRFDVNPIIIECQSHFLTYNLPHRPLDPSTPLSAFRNRKGNSDFKTRLHLRLKAQHFSALSTCGLAQIP